MPDNDRDREPAISISISEGTPQGLEALLAEAAKSGRPAEWRGEGLAQYGIRDGDKMDPATARAVFLGDRPPAPENSPQARPASSLASEVGRMFGRWLDRTRPARSSADTPALPREASEQTATAAGPRPWRHGTWRDREWSAEACAALARLDDALIRRSGGGRAALNLPGWERASIWGWDPPGANYFAVLWRNPATGPRRDEPDIWINGWDNIGGELYRVTTTHMLAMEISLATERPLLEVCAALGAVSETACASSILAGASRSTSRTPHRKRDFGAPPLERTLRPDPLKTAVDLGWQFEPKITGGPG